ncbi:sugar ABC transporter ATP-binding protein [Acidisoma silvae]|uniref:Sugar ABC transporter ATP-binding protein n=1 Tax=Acidisoma silvae TaxID=2802396 RepID=A0A963YVT6_9PROT|nr:sugar ABC transporter ATP-binding protein [Acidisoma silvae]MCB8878044.1 sugar ABC transporter ATP-binding protein [Acidisoma silvae]
MNEPLTIFPNTPAAQPPPAIVDMIGVSKHFGAVKALNDATLSIAQGRMISILGHNGAGKSTLIRILAGLMKPSSGQVSVPVRSRDSEPFGPRQARAVGIRCVFQELSLCDGLTVYENTKIIHPKLRGIGWQNKSRSLIRAALDDIFPGHDIDANQLVGRLSIGRRQMVEIARAFTVTDAPIRLVILDEPTSSLDVTAADQLMKFTRLIRDRGMSCLFISHRLREVLEYTDDIVVMQDGRIVDNLPMSSAVSESILVEKMGSVENKIPDAADTVASDKKRGDRVVDIVANGASKSLHATKGEVIGLAGLAGQGQRELLLQVLAASRRTMPGHKVIGRASYVAGDRQGEGVFPLWTVADNLSIGALLRVSRAGVINLSRERALVARWCADLSIRTPRAKHPIRALSGGNQQKVLIARALADDPDIVLFDDPMRGVDFNTKAELYGLVRRMANAGCTFLWYTTEIAELSNCDRVYVLRSGMVTDEITRDALTEERVISASFDRA